MGKLVWRRHNPGRPLPDYMLASPGKQNYWAYVSENGSGKWALELWTGGWYPEQGGWQDHAEFDSLAEAKTVGKLLGGANAITYGPRNF